MQVELRSEDDGFSVFINGNRAVEGPAPMSPKEASEDALDAEQHHGGLDLREEHEDRGSRCGPGCGWCGACS